jgi:hypothetical protein
LQEFDIIPPTKEGAAILGVVGRPCELATDPLTRQPIFEPVNPVDHLIDPGHGLI